MSQFLNFISGGLVAPSTKYALPKCETKVSFQPEFLSFAREGLQLDHERGGNLQLDTKGQLHQNQTVTGKYSQIVMPRSIVDWHSHPAKCRKNVCALGIPSPADIKNVFIGALSGSNGHMVVSKEGIYAIRVADQTLERLWNNNCEIIHFLAEIDSQFDALHAKFIRKKFNYPTYVKQWLELAHSIGFDVTLFPHDVEPFLMVRHGCNHSIAAEPGASRTIDVIDSLDFIDKHGSACRRSQKKRKR